MAFVDALVSAIMSAQPSGFFGDARYGQQPIGFLCGLDVRPAIWLFLDARDGQQPIGFYVPRDEFVYMLCLRDVIYRFYMLYIDFIKDMFKNLRI